MLGGIPLREGGEAAEDGRTTISCAAWCGCGYCLKTAMKLKLFCLLAVLVVALCPHAEAARARLPAEVFRALDSPSEVTLYATNPDSRAFHWWFSRRFHGYRILGKVSVADPVQRREVAEVVSQAARTYRGDTKCMFSPRHAVRLASGAKTYDFLICFQCLQMEVYAGDQLVASLSSGGSPEVLNRIFRAGGIRVAP